MVLVSTEVSLNFECTQVVFCELWSQCIIITVMATCNIPNFMTLHACIASYVGRTSIHNSQHLQETMTFTCLQKIFSVLHYKARVEKVTGALSILAVVWNQPGAWLFHIKRKSLMDGKSLSKQFWNIYCIIKWIWPWSCWGPCLTFTKS